MLKDLLNLTNLGGEFSRFYQTIRAGEPCAIFGVGFSEKCHLSALTDKKLLYIANNAVYAKQIAEEINDLAGDTVFLPAKHDVLLYKVSEAKDSLFYRLAALAKIKSGAKRIVTTFEALMQLFPRDFEIIRLNSGGNYEPKKLISYLVKNGYAAVEQVTGAGQFSQRGDILDIFPITSDTAYRINFFDDEIENIKILDVQTNAGGEKVNGIIIPPATDIFIEDSEIPELSEYLIDLKKDFSLSGKNREIIDALILSLKENKYAYSLSFLFPLLKNKGSIFDYISNDFLIVYDEYKLLNDSAEKWFKEHSERYYSLYGKNQLSFAYEQMCSHEEIIKGFQKFQQLSFQNISTLSTPHAPRPTAGQAQGLPLPLTSHLSPLNFKFPSSQVPKYYLKLSSLYDDIKSWRRDGYNVLVCAGDSVRAENLQREFNEREIIAAVINRTAASSGFDAVSVQPPRQAAPATPRRGELADLKGVVITNEKLYGGLIYHGVKLAVIGTNDIYNKVNYVRRLKRKRGELFYSPEIGDYVVHEVYGIGRMKGAQKITTLESTKEYAMIEYAEGTVLNIPLEQMDILSKYSGEASPQLSKIGTKEFLKLKEKVQNSIKKIAFDLKLLYRQRLENRGFAFENENALTKEFDKAFPFEETPDQLECISDINKDMESGKVMDRLICGDVGFGKTEVAFRAAFKAILSGKQVALMAPTTILSAQHYGTAVKRFENTPVRIEVLNRFKTNAEQEKIIENLKNGKIDFIIGTHRLLSSDIAFHDLGLLILDEEQRFGVAHKEKIKLLKQNVAALTLSATPIPRTLYMSLMGMRDISFIETPPKERLPVQTYIIEESEAVIRDAVLRELSREGQVFIVYNRVETIYSFAEKIRRIIPECNVGIMHGQMSERELENSVFDFYNGEINVLICTTIIENGIDLPRANTLIVIDADRFGLSQLYQIKGRVGRSNRLAHAYFMFRNDKALNEKAYKRLNALSEFTELSSGYKIAMMDLELRGAGEVLGASQHGHMEKIGYELYAKLLKEEISGKEESAAPQADIRVSAFIPDEYIESSSARLDVYKKIAEAAGINDLSCIENSLMEIYGELPLETESLLKIARLRLVLKNFRAENINIGKGGAAVFFRQNADADLINEKTRAYKDICAFAFSDKPSVIFKSKGLIYEDILDNMLAVFIS